MVHSNTHTALGGLIAADLEQAGLTLRETAEKTGIARTTLKRREQLGDYTVPELVRIAALLGTSSADLLRRAEAAA